MHLHEGPMQRLLSLFPGLVAILALTTFAHGGLRVVPADLDLGDWAAGREVPGIVWLINDDDQPVRVTRAIASDDRVRLVRFTPTTLGPGHAVEVELALRADEREEHILRRTVQFHVDRGLPAVATVRVRSIHSDLHLPPPTSIDSVWSRLRIAPPRLDLGIAAPGQTRTGSVWLINNSDAPLTLKSMKGNCGCLQVPDRGVTTLAAHEAIPIELSMLGEGKPGQERNKYATFMVQDQAPVTLPVSLMMIDPLQGRLLRYLEACERGDSGAMRANLSLDSTIHLGPGADAPVVRRDVDGQPPWHAWRLALHPQRRHEAFRVDGRTITAMRHDVDDIDRILERPGHWTPVEYTYNDVGELATIRVMIPRDLLHGGRAKEFVTWASQHRAEELAALRATPLTRRTADHARRWRALLEQWRRTLPAQRTDATPGG